MNLALNRNPLSRAFTLIELIVVIVVLAILSGVAIPKYFDYAAKAKESAVKGTLGATRSAIANYYANSIVNSGAAAYPTLAQIQALGTVMQEAMPVNNYNGSNAIRTANWAANPPVAGVQGWAYDPATGRFWANSDTAGINENQW